MLPAANPAAARVLEQLGASTINLPTDLSLAQIAAVRAAVDCPLDVYVEAPDNLGGFVRLHEIPELIRVAAPVYIKFGLRNAPDVYPAGTQRTWKRRRWRCRASGYAERGSASICSPGRATSR